jgi:hypothetical protein
MKLISFDVGIKNMAYCIFDLCDNKLSIDKWEIMDLVSEDDVIVNKCNALMKNKKVCGKKAHYCKKDEYFCKNHTKDCKYMLPNKEYTRTKLNKKPIEDLIKLANSCFINLEKKTKKECIDKYLEFYENRCLESCIKKRKKCDQYDLIDLGKQIKKKSNESFDANTIDIVLIENQISPIANRMKTLQGMLAQYFIMFNEDTNIQFISSQNKLKYFEKKSSGYKENKKNAVHFSKETLEKYKLYETWSGHLEVKKKDDLADCFLQGIWYLENKI